MGSWKVFHEADDDARVINMQTKEKEGPVLSYTRHWPRRKRRPIRSAKESLITKT